MRRTAWLHVAALWAIAVAQPLFDLLGRSPEFFVAHRAGAAEVWLVTAWLAVVLPSLLVLCIAMVGLAGTRARSAALGLVVGALGCALAMQLTVRAGMSSWQLAIPLAVVSGVALAVARHRLSVVRTFLSVLSVAAVVTPALFLLTPGIRHLVMGRSGDAVRQAAPAEPGRASIATPVVVVIFDELPLLTLLDADRQIDRWLYPNFASLARDGVWYRNATTVHDFTRWAVPSIVTGAYPRHSALPSAIDHPDTLFTLVSRTHRLEVSEPVTDLCPQSLCPREEVPLGRRLAAIGGDLRVIYLRVILTDDLASQLPDLAGRWAGFDAADDGAAGLDQGATSEVAEAHRHRWRRGMDAARVAPVRRFVEGIGADDPQPTLYFLHALISHYPFYLLPDGKQNGTMATLPAKLGGRWPSDQPWALAQQYQRHLLQMAFVDRLLGDLVARLKQAGLYEKALVVVTADHGMSYTAGAPQRDLGADNAAEIMRVPLIVKYPDRLDVSSHVDDSNVETVDVLPTIADVLDLEVRWRVDGVSLRQRGRPRRPTKAMFTAAGKRREFGAEELDLQPLLERKLQLFGEGTANAQRAPRVSSFDDLIGRPTGDLHVAEGGGAVEILRAWDYDDVDPTADAVVFDVAGRFAAPHPDTFVAVAINGRVEAVTRTWEANARGWMATPRLEAWTQGSNAIDVFVIDRDDRGVLLRRAAVEQVRPEGLNLVLDAAANEWGVRQWGFHAVEAPGGGHPFRWTRDRAELSNLLTHRPPRAVEIGPIRVPGGTPKMLKIEANDCTIFEDTVRPGWSSTLPLDRCDVAGADLTLRFTTEAARGAVDRRRLGVALSSVVLKY